MSLSTQFVTLASMIGMGIWFGASFDTYNRFLKRAKRKGWLVFINDVLFWCIQALLIFIVLFRANYGEWRFYILLALLCGFSAYQALFKQLYIWLLEQSIRIVLRTFGLLVGIVQFTVVNPIRWGLIAVVSILLFLVKILTKLGQGVISLAKLLLKAVLSIVRTTFQPFMRLFSYLWGKVPRLIRNPVEMFVKKIAGMGKCTANTIIKTYKKWTNHTK